MSLEKLFDGCDTYCFPSGGSFNWSEKGTGFGSFYFYEKDGKLMCGNEMMSKEFIKEMLCLMVDECELDTPREENKKEIPDDIPAGYVVHSVSEDHIVMAVVDFILMGVTVAATIVYKGKVYECGMLEMIPSEYAGSVCSMRRYNLKK